jgi:hypothetical protein
LNGGSDPDRRIQAISPDHGQQFCPNVSDELNSPFTDGKNERDQSALTLVMVAKCHQDVKLITLILIEFDSAWTSILNGALPFHSLNQ